MLQNKWTIYVVNWNNVVYKFIIMDKSFESFLYFVTERKATKQKSNSSVEWEALDVSQM